MNAMDVVAAQYEETIRSLQVRLGMMALDGAAKQARIDTLEKALAEAKKPAPETAPAGLTP